MKRAKAPGFTVIELLVVMGVMVMLMSLIGAAVLGLGKKADLEKNKSMIGVLVSALDRFYADFHKYPTIEAAVGANPTESLSFFLCNKFMAPDGLPRGPYLSSSKIQAHGNISPEDTTVMWTGLPKFYGGGTGIKFIIYDIYGKELVYNPTTPKDWSTHFAEWTDNRKIYDLYSLGENETDDSSGLPLGMTEDVLKMQNFDDVGNYNLK